MDSVVNPSQLIILRGLPGSGKSTLAKAITKMYPYYNFEADNFYEHVDLAGNHEYKFDINLIDYAHHHCQGNVAYFLKRGMNVIVSNTTINWNQIQVYVQMASKLDVASIDIVECTQDYGSVHNVPEDVMKRMTRNWQSNEEISKFPYMETIYNKFSKFYNADDYRKILNI